jgi:hypothetical protein
MIPRTISGKLDFWTVHKVVWTGEETTLGLTTGQTTQLATLLTTAQTARTAQLEALSAAKAATATFENAMKALDDFGAVLVTAIKAKATITGDNGIYAKAQLPAPKTPASAGIPPIPGNVRATINTDGAVQIVWGGSTRFQTSFEIYRQLAGQSGWSIVGSSAKRSFIDSTVPVGAGTAAYKIVAKRPAGSSAGSEPVFVVFGSTMSQAA